MKIFRDPIYLMLARSSGAVSVGSKFCVLLEPASRDTGRTMFVEALVYEVGNKMTSYLLEFFFKFFFKKYIANDLAYDSDVLHTTSQVNHLLETGFAQNANWGEIE